MHDTIPSGKDTCKPIWSSDLSRGQSKDNYPNMRLRTCSKIQNKAIIKKNQPSHAMTHGRTKLAMRTPTHTPCTQLLPRHGTLALTVIPCKTHSMKNIFILSPLLGRPNTIPSGKDTGIPSEHGLQFLANKELQMQIRHPTRENKVRPHHQARTPQTKADIQSRPMCTTHPAPRYHPKTSQKGHGSERELIYSQDAQALRRRGGMRGGPRGSPQGGSGGKGRGLRSPGGEGRQMGGSYVSEDNSNHTTLPERGVRGQGRGNRLIEHKRPTIVHTTVQEPMDDNRLSASLKATQETHCNMTILHCRQNWGESEMIIGYGPPPTKTALTIQHATKDL